MGSESMIGPETIDRVLAAWDHQQKCAFDITACIGDPEAIDMLPACQAAAAEMKVAIEAMRIEYDNARKETTG